MGKEIGIDFGTTNTVVSYVNKRGKLRQLSFGGKEIIPSVIYFRSKEEYYIGDKAKKLWQLNPTAGIANFKTAIGDNTRHEIIPDEGKPFFKSSREIAQLFLNKIVLGLENELLKEFGALDGFIDQAVITVPAKFSSTEKSETKKAAHFAGFSDVKLAAEPTAAAVAYEDSQGTQNDAVILVYDFGGGTFDVSIIRRADGAFEEIVTGGDKHLGGNILTDILVEEILNRINDDFGVNFPRSEEDFDEEIHGISLTDFRMNLSDLWHIANNIKENLSSDEAVSEQFNFILPTGSRLVEVNFTREELEAFFSEYIDRTVDITLDTIKRAKNLGVNSVDQIVLAGGCSNIPLVKDRLEQALQNQDVVFCDDVSTLISRGAALLAHRFIDAKAVSNVDMGITATDGVHFGRFMTIIPDGVSLPCSKKKIFYLSRDDQRRLEINYYERDVKNFPEAVRVDDEGIELIDTLVIDNLPPKLSAAEVHVEVEFTAQTDGSLNINAVLINSDGKNIGAGNMNFQKKSDLE